MSVRPAPTAPARRVERPAAPALALLALFACGAPVARAEDGLPGVLSEVGIDQRLNEQVPLDLPFRDEQGAEVRLGDYFGERPVILALAYYECPMLCTLVLNGLVKALKVLTFDPGREFEIVTVSIDPSETPALAAAKKATHLKEYDRPGAAAGWHFLTGDAPAIEQLARAVGFRYRYVPEQQQYAHAAGIMVLTPDGRLARYFYGAEYSPRDLRFGLIDAAQHKIGTLADQLLLFCFHYNPTTGKYGAFAMGSMRAAGILTVLALGTFIVVMLRRERTHQINRTAGA